VQVHRGKKQAKLEHVTAVLSHQAFEPGATSRRSAAAGNNQRAPLVACAPPEATVETPYEVVLSKKETSRCHRDAPYVALRGQ